MDLLYVEAGFFHERACVEFARGLLPGEEPATRLPAAMAPLTDVAEGSEEHREAQSAPRYFRVVGHAANLLDAFGGSVRSIAHVRAGVHGEYQSKGGLRDLVSP